MPRRSKISTLPAEVRAWLDRALAEGNFSGYEQLEQLLTDKGYTIGKSSIHRYGQQLEQRLLAVKTSTEAARAIADAAPDEADLRSAAVMSLVQTDIFNVMVALQEAGTADPEARLGLMGKAARSIAELSRASVNQKKWETATREKIAAKMAALESEAAAGRGNLDAETLRRVREEIYGIA